MTPNSSSSSVENTGDVPLTLFWIKPDGEERKTVVIPPGGRARRTTTLGHRFRVRGPNGFKRTFTIQRQRQVFEVKHEPTTADSKSARRPNIVFCMADDWSWPHAGILGDPVVKTPHFDRVARQGVEARSRRQVDNRQPPVAQHHAACGVDPGTEVVRPSVSQGGGHPNPVLAQALLAQAVVEGNKSRNAAHLQCLAQTLFPQG